MPLGPRALSHLGPRAPPGPGPSPGPKSVRFIVPGMSFRVRVWGFGVPLGPRALSHLGPRAPLGLGPAQDPRA